VIKCQDCGRDNLTTTRFCAGCGAQLRIELPVHDPARVLKRMRKAFARRGARERAEVRGEARQLASASRRLDLVLMVVAALTAAATWWGLSTAVVALNRPPPVVAVAPLPVPPSLPETRAVGDAADAAVASAAPAVRPLVGAASDRRPALEPGGLDGTDAWGRPYRADGGLSRRAALNRDRGAAPVRVASNEMELPAERTVEAPPPPPPPPAAAPPRDRWQLRDDALGRCAGGPLDRFLCEQRVRAQACEGLWGQVPECPSGRVADYGN
jgi:hypothetical protein